MNKRQAKTIALGLAVQVLKDTSAPAEISRRGMHYVQDDVDKIQLEWGGVVDSLTDRYKKLLVTSDIQPPFHTPGVAGPAHLAAPTGERCPRCGGEILLRRGTHGRFRGCAQYPECEWKAPFVVGKCRRCGSDLVEKGGARGTFFGCSRYPDCTYTQDPDTLPAT
ncbi:MAG: hypothetical protein E3J64_09965 [Anaerolineales bacterium]|nr:MAG: hypothetical protein E3J64_09965 [Anaerolineales bacterium]